MENLESIFNASVSVKEICKGLGCPMAGFCWDRQFCSTSPTQNKNGSTSAGYPIKKDTILANNQERFQVCMEPTAIPKFMCGLKDSGVSMVCVDVGVFFLT